MACQIACAQSTDLAVGTIHGYVTDLGKKPVSAATVDLYGEAAPATTPGMTSVTDASGYYVFNNVAPGNYSLGVSRDYYVSTTTTAVVSGDNSLNLTLPVKQAAMTKLSSQG